MITFRVEITKDEKLLVDAIQEVEYGELLDVELDGDSGQPPIAIDVARQTMCLLKLIQDDGVRFFHSIRIHQGQPTLAEVPGITQAGSFKCRKQHRFN